MERQNLSARTRVRRLAADAEGAGVVPDADLKLFLPGAAGEVFPQPFDDFRLVEVRNLRVDPERQPRSPLLVLLFDELVVAGAAAELRGQALLEDIEEIAVKIIHAFAGEFFVAPDVMQMNLEAGALHGASAISFLQNSIIAVLDVEKQLRVG